MPSGLRFPMKRHLVLLFVNQELGFRRFYSLMSEWDLFGAVRLVPN